MNYVWHDGKSQPEGPFHRIVLRGDLKAGREFSFLWPDGSDYAGDVIGYELADPEAPYYDPAIEHGEQVLAAQASWNDVPVAGSQGDQNGVRTFGSRGAVLEQARIAVTQDRAATHGKLESSFGQLAAVWSLRLGVTVTPAQVALMLVDLKVTRAWGNPDHFDNWVDIAGYAACGGEIAGGGT